MKTLVIPDIHHRIQNVDIALNNNEYDEVVFLGDWLDSFYEPPFVASFEDTCIYLKNLITDHKNKDKFVFLVGNHDINYIYCNNGPSTKSCPKLLPYYCSGFTGNKAKKFRKTFFDKGLKDEFFRKNFKLAHRSQGWSFSHAGIIMEHFPYGYNIDDLISKANDAWANFRDLSYSCNYLVSSVGVCRGGRQSVGGLTWCDWYNEFYPCSHVGKQICGHTTVKEPSSIAKYTDHESWNLDTVFHYGIIEDSVLSVKEYAVSKPN